MLPFAVRVAGLHEEGVATWVLAVDRDGVLIAHTDDNTLHWYPLEECTFVKCANPEQPKPVFAVAPNGVQPQNHKEPAILVPNRAERRRNGS